MKTREIEYTCKNCEAKFTVEVEPFIRGCTYGPPENCYPDEGGTVSPEECEHCQTPVDNDACQEEAFPTRDYEE